MDSYWTLPTLALSLVVQAIIDHVRPALVNLTLPFSHPTLLFPFLRFCCCFQSDPPTTPSSVVTNPPCSTRCETPKIMPTILLCQLRISLLRLLLRLLRLLLRVQSHITATVQQAGNLSICLPGKTNSRGMGGLRRTRGTRRLSIRRAMASPLRNRRHSRVLVGLGFLLGGLLRRLVKRWTRAHRRLGGDSLVIYYCDFLNVI